MRVARWAVALAACFLVLTEQHAWQDALVAAAVGLLVAALSARGTKADQRGARARLRSIVAMPWLLAGIVWLVVRGSWSFSRALLTRGRAVATRSVEVPVEDRTNEGIALSGAILSSTPGSVLAEVDEARGVMIVDELEPRDVAEARDVHRRFYRKFQRPVRP